MLHERNVRILRRRRGMRLDNIRGLDILGGLIDSFCTGGLLDRVFQLPGPTQKGIFQIVSKGYPETGCENPSKVCQLRLIFFVIFVNSK